MAADSLLGSVRQSVLRRWLEVLLPLYTVGLMFVWFRPEYLPAVLAHGGETPVVWVAWGVVGAMGGILILWALIVGFFLVYSPLYLVARLPMLVGQGAWVDRRELQFYVCCFLLLACLLALMFWNPTYGMSAFVLAAGCGPVFWRWLI